MREEIQGKNRKDLINRFEEILIENVEDLSKNEDFFQFPLENIFSIISKVDFNKTCQEKGNNYEILKNLIQNTIKFHYEEKETIMLLQFIDITKILLSYEQIFSIFEFFTNCQIINHFCHLYKEKNNSQKICNESEIQVVYIPITEKPKDFEPNIFKACKEGKLSSVQWLIEKENVDPEVEMMGRDSELDLEELDSPIHCASKYGQLEIVKYLIEQQNVDIDFIGDDRKTPLHFACEECQCSTAEYLISKGANIKAKSRYGNRAIHYASSSGLLPIVQYLVEKQNFDINIKGYEQRTPLHYACEKGHLSMAEYLISKGADVNMRDQNGKYRFPHTSQDFKNRKGNYSIHYAAYSGLLSIVQYLIEKRNCDKDIKGAEGKTPLHFACVKGHISIAEYLISKGADVNIRDQNGKCTIHYASQGGLLSIIKYVIERCNCDIDIRDFTNQTPLHYACQIYSDKKESQLQIIQYLISKGANIEAKDNKGMTPLHYATLSFRPAVIKFLLSKGANRNIKDNDGCTPYNYAITEEILKIYE